MERDIDLIRRLLLDLEQNDTNSQITDVEINKLRYHKRLLIEANLAQGSIDNTLFSDSNRMPDVTLLRLTWTGHEFIDNYRQDELWNKIKLDLKDASFDTLLKLGKEVAESYARKKLASFLE